ncbi:helicase-like transcription factor [Teratosphaeria destructans]|uniref:Helicase-like transcription factor n=1 Tax=Teratosphaeria destructans TaxID=418781 RepID=A0A9W7SP43_9PEZI|nr:helicase-like transcription factor [Teratosphaeria destructans]
MSWLTRGWGFGGGRGGAVNSPPSQPEQHQVHPASQSPVPRTVDPRQLFSARSPQPLNLQNYPGNGIQPAVNQSPPCPVRPSATHHPIGLPRSLPQQNGMVQAPYHMTEPSLPYTPVQQPTTFSPLQHQPNMYQTQPLFTSSPHQHNDLLQNMHQYNQNLTDSGPKQSRKPATSTETNSDSNKPAIPKYDPRVLLDRRGAGAKAAENGDDDLLSEATRKEQLNPAESEDSAPGQGNLIARQYGLSNRDTTLQHTKRKSQAQDEDEGPDRKKTKAVVDNRNSSGQLGQHLKKEREHYAAERGPSATVDLTADDEGGDDELVVTAVSKVQSKAWENEIVCLGALSGNAHMSRLPMVSPKMQAAVGKEYWPLLRVDLKRDFGALHQKVEVMDKQKNSCGMLEPKLGRAIARLLDGKGLNNVDVTAYMPSRKRESGEYAGQPISALLKIGIVLYSPRGKADLIGKYLSQEQLFLSQPNHLGMSHGKEYYNPHVPKSYAPAGGSGPRQPQTGRSTTYSMRTVEEVQQQTMSMFDNLTKHENLPRMEPQSGLIKTELLDHQKQALHFLTDHERDDSQTFSLWKPHVDQKGLAKWEHVITGEELRSEPDPIRGGILADMMGLGKTLSILSLIAETKETAKTFFKQPSIDPGKINAIGTLIICPKSVLSNWEEQLATHIKNDKLRCYTYHGSNRLTDSAELAKFNIVLTTYNTAAAEFATKGKPLAALCWFRIVLDEAHTIRTQNTQVFKAAIELSAERRWAVTGTPVQNRLEDLQALIRFLRIKPFHDPHVWTQYLDAPLKNGNPQAFNQLRLLVDSITLRRGKDKIGLTGKVETIVRLEFSTEDRRIYADMSEKQGTKLQRLTGGFNRRLKGKAYAHILKAIGMLRMFCAHGLDMLSEDDRKEVLQGLNSDNAIAIDLGDEPEFTDYNNFTTDKYAFDYLQNETDTDGNDCIICARKVGIDKSEGDEDDDRGLESSDDEGDHIIGYLTPCFHLLCAGCKLDTKK